MDRLSRSRGAHIGSAFCGEPPLVVQQNSTCVLAPYARFAMRITGSDNPFFNGTSIFSMAT